MCWPFLRTHHGPEGTSFLVYYRLEVHCSMSKFVFVIVTTAIQNATLNIWDQCWHPLVETQWNTDQTSLGSHPLLILFKPASQISNICFASDTYQLKYLMLILEMFLERKCENWCSKLVRKKYLSNFQNSNRKFFGDFF